MYYGKYEIWGKDFKFFLFDIGNKAFQVVS